VNGIVRCLPWPEAYALLWALDLGWVVLANWYRYRLGRYKREFFLDTLKEISGAELEFLYALHFARLLPITERDLPGDDPDTLGIPRQGLTKRRSRCGGGMYPPGYDPIETVPATGPGGRSVNGYLLRRGVTSIMILGAEGGRYFPWQILLKPPNPRGLPSVLDETDLLKARGARKLLPLPKMSVP
jgi:hypothetical protein